MISLKDYLNDGFSPDSKSQMVYNRTLVIECKVSAVFLYFSILKIGVLVECEVEQG